MTEKSTALLLLAGRRFFLPKIKRPITSAFSRSRTRNSDSSAAMVEKINFLMRCMSMLKNKKALAMSVLCAIASVGFVVSASAAEQSMHGNLDEVVVEGSADVLPGGED